MTVRKSGRKEPSPHPVGAYDNNHATKSLHSRDKAQNIKKDYKNYANQQEKETRK